MNKSVLSSHLSGLDAGRFTATEPLERRQKLLRIMDCDDLCEHLSSESKITIERIFQFIIVTSTHWSPYLPHWK